MSVAPSRTLVNEKSGFEEPRLRQHPAIAHRGGKHVGSFAPNPAFIRTLRFILYTLTTGAALATSVFGLLVVHYYDTHKPNIAPSWGSLIACIVFGFITAVVLLGTLLVTPRIFRPGSFAFIFNQTRMELVLLFSLAAIWVCGAIALASDLRGYEFCLWDGYYHYPKPADFQDSCRLINWSVIFAYITFGLAALQMVIIWTATIYIVLYLDQEALTEPTSDLGGRAYRSRVLTLAHRRSVMTASSTSPSFGGARESGVLAGGRTVPRLGDEENPFSDGVGATKGRESSVVDPMTTHNSRGGYYNLPHEGGAAGTV